MSDLHERLVKRVERREKKDGRERAAILDKLMRDKDLTSDEVAKFSGVHPVTVRRWRTVSLPYQEVLDSILAHYAPN